MLSIVFSVIKVLFSLTPTILEILSEPVNSRSEFSSMYLHSLRLIFFRHLRYFDEVRMEKIDYFIPVELRSNYSRCLAF